FFPEHEGYLQLRNAHPGKGRQGDAPDPEGFRQGGERPVFQGRIQDKTADRIIVQLAHRKSGHSEGKQGQVDQRTHTARIWKTGGSFYNINILTLDWHK